MQDLDVILGMDWLGENRVLIDCENRIVTLRLPLGDNFTYKGATSKGAPSVITSLRAKKLIRSDASAFLASVTLDNSNKQITSSVQIVRELVDVFLEDRFRTRNCTDLQVTLQDGTCRTQGIEGIVIGAVG